MRRHASWQSGLKERRVKITDLFSLRKENFWGSHWAFDRMLEGYLDTNEKSNFITCPETAKRIFLA